MKYFITLVILLFSFNANAQSGMNALKVKTPTSCFEFVDLYSKVVENIEDPTIDDQHKFELAMERIMGYIGGIEVGTRTKIIMREHNITEWSILADVQKACLIAPNISLDDAVNSLLVVNAAIKNSIARSNQANWQSCQQFCNQQ
ncbi:MAG: hypothetical protein BWY78_01458 [Alphaproteobacteria bacterium ADurb.Bin438]|nr:MAG: hypothetical protein BWY78_01458 [Alphaproteobacteria bacterium ADurb.Bin438]